MNNISPSIIDMNYDYMTFAVYTSSSTEPTCPAYKIGINILGNYQEQYKTSFPGQKVAEGSFYYWRRWR